MRKSTNKTRLMYAGFTTGALVSALLVTPQSASAALTATATIVPSSGGVGVTITATKSTFMSGVTTSTGANWTTADTCPSTFTTPASGAVLAAVTATKTGADTATVPLPATVTGAARTLTLCIYSAAANGTGSLLGDAYYTVSPLALTPSSGPASGTITANQTGFLAGATGVLGGMLQTAACPTNWASLTASATGANVTPTRVNDDRATVPWPTGTAIPSLNSGAARAYNLCVYTAATTSGTLLGESAYTVAPVATLSPTTGISGGGNTVTLTAPTGSTLPTGTLTGYFATGSCPIVLPASSNLTQATVTRNTAGSAATLAVPAGVAGAGSTATPYVACLYAGSTPGSSALAATSGSNVYNVTLPRVDLSSTQGAANSGSFIASSTTNFLTTSPNPGAVFTVGERCPATYSVATVGGITPVAASIRRLANNRAGVTVPTSGITLVNSAPTPYQVCMYSDATSTGKLIANSVYTVVVTPSITSVSPDAGPSQGGATITVYGTNLPTTAGSIRATLGGTALTVTPGTETYFTAVTPLHAVADNVPLIVTTDLGTFTLANAYDFANSITVSPNTAPNTVPTVDLDITGVGFLSLPFAAVTAAVNPNSSNAHVYLVNGVYNPASVTGNTTPPKGNAPVAECGNVQVVTDTELFCTLQLNQRRDALGTFDVPTARGTSNTDINDVATTAGSPIITSAAEAQFTSADVGAPIKGFTDNLTIPAGTTIVSVTSPTTAVLSANALLTASADLDVTIGGVARPTISAVTSTTGSTTISVASGAPFTSADIGRVVTSSVSNKIAPGSTIVAVAANGNSATLSTPAIGDSTVNIASLFTPSPVPNGAYTITIVSSGALNAATVTGYSQSIVSSGSTFTVAPF